MTSTPVISKGSSFVLSTGTVEMKSIIVEDPDAAVGAAENVVVTAHDGTKYSTPGVTGDNTLSLNLLQTYEEFTSLMTYAYGSPSISGSVSTWDLETPSDTTGTITIETPKSGTNQISWVLREAKALSIQPGLPIGSFATMQLNMTGDKWEAVLDENAS